jgi:hypothetical protein
MSSNIVSNLLNNIEMEEIKKMGLKVKGLDSNLYIRKEKQKNNRNP